MDLLRRHFSKGTGDQGSDHDRSVYPAWPDDKGELEWGIRTEVPRARRRSSRNQRLFLGMKLLFVIILMTTLWKISSPASSKAYASLCAYLGTEKRPPSPPSHLQSAANFSASEITLFPLAAKPEPKDPVNAEVVDRSGWKAVSCDSSANGFDCTTAHTVARDTFWKSGPDQTDQKHWIAIEFPQPIDIHSIEMTPATTDLETGGAPRQHRVDICSHTLQSCKANEELWRPVAVGTWRETNLAEKYATFEPIQARSVRLVVLDITSRQLGAKFTLIKDLRIWRVKSKQAVVKDGGQWGLTLDFPLVPVTAFLNPRTDHLITLAADNADGFEMSGGINRRTVMATWNPKSNAIVETTISETQHTIFCPGTSYDADGKVLLTGGSTSLAFTIYDPVVGSDADPGKAKLAWTRPKDKNGAPRKLQTGRGYQGQTYLPNGKTFVIGGAWGFSGWGELNKSRDGEIYNPGSDNNPGGWERLKDVHADAIRMDAVYDPGCKPEKNKPPPTCSKIDWQQHHPWLFAWTNNSVFHAGPSKRMNWISTEGDGSIQSAGVRGEDSDAVCGIAVMYDAVEGRILTAGGAPNYHYWIEKKDRGLGSRLESSRNAFEMQLANVGAQVTAKQVSPMSRQRIFANAVILPTGDVFVVGGQVRGEPFLDETWVSVPEIYTPAPGGKGGTWSLAAPHSSPRVYHSWALLLLDGSVLVGGSGLGGDTTDHYDAQIYKPQYLVGGAKRPKIVSIADNKVLYKVGDKVTITTDMAIDAVSLIRYSAATHALNNDLRRIPLKPTVVGGGSANTYSFVIPGESGVTLPGYWMLFVLNNKIPSEARTVRITLDGKEKA